MGLTRFAIDLAVKNPKIESFNTYLFVGPHPDDIEIGAGATISKLVKMGKKVVYLICTDGRYGKENMTDDISCEELAAIRKQECLDSAGFLGVKEVRFLNLPDGAQYEYSQLCKGLAETIMDVKPDIVFGPDPDVDSECHIDHLNVGRAVKEVAHFANYPEIFDGYLQAPSSGIDVKAIALFMTAKPNQFVNTRGHFRNQLESLYYHKSQYAKGSTQTDSVVLYLKLRSIEFGIKRFCGRAEGFRMMSRTRMHCLPEASK